MKKLRVKWSKREKDVVIHYPNPQDGHMLHGFLFHAKDPVQKESFLKTLEERGYDLTTLKFEIQKKESV